MTAQDGDDRISRREVGKASVAVGVAMALESAEASAQARRRKRYAIVGIGHRSNLYQEAIQVTFPEHAELAACCDTNPGRMRLAVDYAKKHGRAEPKTYAAADFDRMIAEVKPDTVIVTTIDATHDQYICRAMALGCDVISEKPMTTDAAKCQAIIDTRRTSGKKCTVAFNYRYTPVRSQLKELLMSGVIGDVLSVDFNWVLDTFHGADYFRRWHGQKRFSGGLLVHKSTHHFDLVNWWLSAIPVTVRAHGKREFYTPKNAKRLGLTSHHERCHTCPEKLKCGFELDLSRDPYLKAVYLDNEQYDGYFRDRCVFRPEIDIEDTMNVLVNYDTGATLSYTLNAFAAWEGYSVSFNGTKGRIEHKMEERVMAPDPSVPLAVKGDGTYIRVYPLRRAPYHVTPQTGKGGHNGGDPLMARDLFAPQRGADRLLRAADERSGAYSILVGAAANQAILTDKPVRISDLVENLRHPSYARTPSSTSPVPMPPKMSAPPKKS